MTDKPNIRLQRLQQHISELSQEPLSEEAISKIESGIASLTGQMDGNRWTMIAADLTLSYAITLLAEVNRLNKLLTTKELPNG